jgi:hypothetical protein
MTKLFVLCAALCVGLSTTAVFARGGGMGSHHGGASGTSVAAPGTNSSGTALSSSGHGAKGYNPVLEQDEAKVDKMIKSICRGC